MGGRCRWVGIETLQPVLGRGRCMQFVLVAHVVTKIEEFKPWILSYSPKHLAISVLIVHTELAEPFPMVDVLTSCMARPPNEAMRSCYLLQQTPGKRGPFSGGQDDPLQQAGMACL